MATTSRLNMSFDMDNGKVRTYSLTDPKADITAEEVRPVMQSIIDKEAFIDGTAVPEAIKSATVVRTETTDIIAAS